MLKPVKILKRLFRQPPKPEQQAGDWFKPEAVYHEEFTKDRGLQPSRRPWIEPGRVLGWMDRGGKGWFDRE